MNPIILIVIGVIFFLFIFLTILFGPIGFIMMLVFTVMGVAGYIHEMNNEKK